VAFVAFAPSVGTRDLVGLYPTTPQNTSAALTDIAAAPHERLGGVLCSARDRRRADL